MKNGTVLGSGIIIVAAMAAICCLPAAFHAPLWLTAGIGCGVLAVRWRSETSASKNSGELLPSTLNAAEGFFWVDLKTLELTNCVQPTVLRGFGAVGQLQGRSVYDLFNDYEIEIIDQWRSHPPKGGETRRLSLDLLLPAADGKTLPVRFIFQFFQQNLGVTVADLPDADRMARSNILLRSGAAAFGVSAVILFADGRICYASPKVRNRFAPGGASSRIWELLPLLFTRQSYQELWQSVQAQEVVMFRRFLDGRCFECRCLYLRVDEGYLYAKITEVTEALAQEKSMKQALAAERAANQKRISVLNAINYELRRPLTGIIGFADLLREEGLSPEERQEYLALIITSSESLLQLWSGVLELTELDCRQQDIVLEQFNLNSLFRWLLNSYVPRLNGKAELRLDKTLRDSEAQIISDESILLRIFEKFLDNSVRSTVSGVISLGYEAGQGTMTFYVSDSGTVLSAAQRNNIFEPFRSDNFNLSDSQTIEGLGLTIANELIKLLGGTLSVLSPDGRGTCYSFTLPVERVFGDGNGIREAVPGATAVGEGTTL